MYISADENGARLVKMAREEIGLQPRSKIMLRHAQQDFDTISSEVFLFSPFFAYQARKTSVVRVLSYTGFTRKYPFGTESESSFPP